LEPCSSRETKTQPPPIAFDYLSSILLIDLWQVKGPLPVVLTVRAKGGSDRTTFRFVIFDSVCTGSDQLCLFLSH